MSSDNGEAGRLVAAAIEAGLSHSEGCALADTWRFSRFGMRDGYAFIKAGILTPSETRGAVSFRTWKEAADAQANVTPKKAASSIRKVSQ